MSQKNRGSDIPGTFTNSRHVSRSRVGTSAAPLLEGLWFTGCPGERLATLTGVSSVVPRNTLASALN
jgi:hypothetical protein